MSDTVIRRDLRLLLRYTPLLLVPLLLLASTFPEQFRVPLGYWLLAMAAAALFVVADRWPLPVSLAVSALAVPMFLVDAWGLSGLVPYLGAVALVHAVAHTTPVASTVAALGWAVAALIGVWSSHMPFWRPATAVEALAVVGLPVLLGLYLRAHDRLAERLRLDAAMAESRRAEAESHTRAVERSAMARELHDLVAHHMASIVLRIEVARHVLDDPDPRVRAVLDDVHDTAADALADIRRLLVVLRDPGLGEVALVEAEAVLTELDAAVTRTRAAGFTVDATVSATTAGLDAIGRLTLLRVVQESLTNVMKHADRDNPVEVLVADTPEGIIVRVASGERVTAGAGRDAGPTARSGDVGFAAGDGSTGSAGSRPGPGCAGHDSRAVSAGRAGSVGFAAGDRNPGLARPGAGAGSSGTVGSNGSAGQDGVDAAGHGIIGMRERVDMAGGTFDVRPVGSGWVVEALLPDARGGDRRDDTTGWGE
ncbi:histidine kinase [Nocardia jejuensis]|uniref:histidine kinase n=1 Tax=Nocardia jejuensis TaxID=328049 RepID=UPI00082ACB03